MSSERKVKSVATDVPDHYDDVDEQLIRDYPELKGLIERDQSCARCGARVGRRLCAGCV